MVSHKKGAMRRSESRQLLAVLAADVVGYSMLMSLDEEATARRLDIARRYFDDSIKRHDGRIANTAGDSVLAVFASPVQAVRCALDVQRKMAVRNASLKDQEKILYRMGVNVGDVLMRGRDVLGEGVNVAARLEGIAEPGGVCASRAVVDHVGKKMPGKINRLGKKELKNIPYAVDVYAIRAAGQSSGEQQRIQRLKAAAVVVAGIFILAGSLGLGLAAVQIYKTMMSDIGGHAQVDERPRIPGDINGGGQ